jgi:HK97 family phage major capsid protein
MTTQELMEKRANIIAQARQIVDTAGAEKRDMTDEEQANFDKAMEDASKLKGQIERIQNLEAMEAGLEQSAGEPVQRAMKPGESGSVATAVQTRAAELRARYPQLDDARIEAEVQRERFFPRILPAFMLRDSRGLKPDEQRALQQDIQASGGYLSAPIEFVDTLIQAVDNLVYMRQWATKFQAVGSDGLGAPSLDNDPADPSWTAELAIGTEDSTMSFGNRELFPHPLAKYIKVSRKLIRTVPNVQNMVVQRLAYKRAVTQENAFLNGHGSGQPLGVFTASDNGIGTGQDISTGNTGTNIQFDGLYEAKYGLKQQYRARARWMFHRDGMKQIAKLKDGEARYIWQESVRVGEPDRIMGIPVWESEYVPSTFTTGKYVGILGDFSFYWIADALDMELQVLSELYAATNQVGLVDRSECDGMPVLAEAFVRVKLG